MSVFRIIANEQLRYTYDGGWNMTARTENGVGTSYVINDRNQVTSAGGKACSFDMNGNLTNRVYDSTGRKTYIYVFSSTQTLKAFLRVGKSRAIHLPAGRTSRERGAQPVSGQDIGNGAQA